MNQTTEELVHMVLSNGDLCKLAGINPIYDPLQKNYYFSEKNKEKALEYISKLKRKE